MSKASRCYIALWGDIIIGFVSSMTLPNPIIKNGWRASRTVILPEFQGMGIGTRLSDAVAQIHLDQGYRYFSRTSHPRMGYYREHSNLWKPTSKNKKLRTDEKHEHIFKNHYVDNKRVCFSHEYIGVKYLPF